MVGILCWVPSHAVARGPVDENTLFAPVEEMRKKADFPGLSLATFTSQGLQTTYATGTTRADAAGKPMSAQNTLVPVASVSKLFTAISIFQMIDKGVISLGTRLSELPNTPFYKAVARHCPARLNQLLGKIQIRHLLSHQGGINQDTPGSNMWWDADSIEDGAYQSTSDFMERFCEIEQVLEPGTAPLYKYSNAGFNLLGQIVASYGGRGSLANYVSENILKPLDMQNTYYDLSAQELDKLTFGHGNAGTDTSVSPKGRRILAKVFSPNSYAGSIGVNSTAEDLTKLGRALLAWTVPSQNKTHDLGLGKIWEQILNPISHNHKLASIGHGFMIFDTTSANYSFHNNGYVCYGHLGTGFGSRAIVYVCPELDWGFVGLSNSRDLNREDLMQLVSQLMADAGLIQRAPQVQPAVAAWITRVRKFHADTVIVPLPKVEKMDPDQIPASLRDFVGVYVSGVVGEIEVSVSVNGKLMIRGVEIEQEGPEQFRYPVNAASSDVNEPVTFLRSCKSHEVIGILQALTLNAKKKGVDSSQAPCAHGSNFKDRKQL